MKIKSRCEKCNSNLNTQKIIKANRAMGNIGEMAGVKEIKCPSCGHFTQVTEKPYI